MRDNIKVITASGEEHEIAFTDTRSAQGTINGNPFSWDVQHIKEGSYHVLYNQRSYQVEIVQANYAEKQFTLLINGQKHTLNVKDRFDTLLQSLGLDMAAAKVADVKAPMPGLVLQILAESGSEVKKGDALLILEAMKMENIIKSPADGVVRSIAIKQGQAVEKNQVLLSFA